MSTKDILDYAPAALKEKIISMDEPRHRAAQILQWVYKKKVRDFTQMTNLPKALISKLDIAYQIGSLKCDRHATSVDGTEKYLFTLQDQQHIETVLIKENQRKTLCISTQVGCRYGCPFCATGLVKFNRNLTVGEIIDQCLCAEEISDTQITNIVFMGMGEPLDNYTNVTNAIRVLNSNDCLNIGARKITISTCGIVPGIRKLNDFDFQIELSVSLHAVNNYLRNKLVPVNRKFPLDELISTCETYSRKKNRIITLEYLLLDNINDSMKDANELARIAARLRAKINLIPYNSFLGMNFNSSSPSKVTAFQQRLTQRGSKATIRKSKGSDISAACGQLAAGKRGRK